MTKTRRYRTALFRAEPGKQLGEVHLKDNESIVRETAFFEAETQQVRCIILIKEKVDTANEKQRKSGKNGKSDMALISDEYQRIIEGRAKGD